MLFAVRRRHRYAQRNRPGLGEAVDQLDQVVLAVSLAARNVDQLLGFAEYGALRHRPAGDADATAAPELEQALVAQQAQRPQHRVGVHAQDRGEVTGRWKSLARAGLPVGDRAADIGRDLVVQKSGIATVYLDFEYRASHNITNE